MKGRTDMQTREQCSDRRAWIWVSRVTIHLNLNGWEVSVRTASRHRTHIAVQRQDVACSIRHFFSFSTGQRGFLYGLAGWQWELACVLDHRSATSHLCGEVRIHPRGERLLRNYVPASISFDVYGRFSYHLIRFRKYSLDPCHHRMPGRFRLLMISLAEIRKSTHASFLHTPRRIIVLVAVSRCCQRCFQLM